VSKFNSVAIQSDLCIACGVDGFDRVLATNDPPNRAKIEIVRLIVDQHPDPAPMLDGLARLEKAAATGNVGDESGFFPGGPGEKIPAGFME
jgi:hypothetical protein